MRIDSQLTDSAILNELGTRLSRRRLDRNLSQVQLANEAGVAGPPYSPSSAASR